MRSKTKLELLRQLRHRKSLAQGFTLIELMIVVAIVGIISAMALPRFLGVQAAARAGSQIGEKVGLAKECATYIASGGVAQAPSNCTLGVTNSFVASWGQTVPNLGCLGVTAASASTATVRVGTDGQLTCTFG